MCQIFFFIMFLFFKAILNFKCILITFFPSSPLYSPNFKLFFKKPKTKKIKQPKPKQSKKKNPPNYNQIKVHKKTGVIRCWSAIEHEARPGMVEIPSVGYSTGKVDFSFPAGGVLQLLNLYPSA